MRLCAWVVFRLFVFNTTISTIAAFTTVVVATAVAAATTTTTTNTTTTTTTTIERDKHATIIYIIIRGVVLRCTSGYSH